MAAHRYWRIRNQNVEGSYVGFSEIEMAISPAGSNVCAGGTPYASSFVGGFPVSNAFDGGTAADWLASGDTGIEGSFIGYDFGSGNDQDIVEFRIAAPNFDTGKPASRVFTIESSDDDVAYHVEWIGFYLGWVSTTLTTFSKPTAGASNQYWGIYCSQNNIPNGQAIIAEIELRTSPGGSNVATGGTPFGFTDNSTAGNAFDGDPSTYWFATGGGVANFIGYELPSAMTIVEATIQASTPFPAWAPKNGKFVYSQDGKSWIGIAPFAGEIYSAAETKTFTIEAAEDQVFANQLVNFVVARFRTQQLDANQVVNFAVINFPTPFIQANQFVSQAVFRAANPMRVNEVAMLAVCKGILARPAVSPWTFTLDGHEYLVINTYNETLVYDFHAEHWYVWGSGDKPLWNPQIGQNWNANLGAIMAGLGGIDTTNIICGDGTTSALYFLDTGLDEDYSPLGDPAKKYVRVITGQLISRSNNYTAIPGVEVSASDGRTVVASDMEVTLTYSDDTGVSYNSFGSRTVIVGDYSPVLQWRSLGSYRQPGRLLRLTDYGAVRRVDDWTTTDG